MSSTLNPQRFIQLLRSIPPSTQFIVLLDMDHTSLEIRQLMAHPEVLRTLRQTNRNLIIMEGPIEANGALEFISRPMSRMPPILQEPTIRLAGRIAAENFPSAYHAHHPARGQARTRAEIEQFLRPMAYDIQIRMPDTGYGEMPAATLELLSRMSGDISEAKCGDITSAAWRNAGEMTPEMESVSNDLLARRLNDGLDAAIALNSVDLAEGRPATILYGGAHVLRSNDINNHLPGSVTIALFPNERSRLVSSQRPGSAININEVFTELPNYMYDVTSDRVTRLEAGTPEAERFWARVPNPVTGTTPVLTAQEHAACVAELPPRLRAHAPQFQDVSTEELGGLPVMRLTQPPRTQSLEADDRERR